MAASIGSLESLDIWVPAVGGTRKVDAGDFILGTGSAELVPGQTQPTTIR